MHLTPNIPSGPLAEKWDSCRFSSKHGRMGKRLYACPSIISASAWSVQLLQQLQSPVANLLAAL
ncbi:hypothetical protein VU08_06825 [Desulfobulbus sp. F5]|nr:hypothetical protein [Desulfobulbus sp. F5]